MDLLQFLYHILEKAKNDLINTINFNKSDNGGEIFSDYAQALSAPVKESVLIDDSVKNCEVFRSLGGTAFRIVPGHDVNSYLELLS